MYPFMNIFGRTIPSYSVMAIIGTIAVAIYAVIRCRQEKIELDDMAYFLVFAFIFMPVFAVVLYWITEIKEVARVFTYLFRDFKYFTSHIPIGLVYYGGLFGVFFGGFVYAKAFKTDVRRMFMIMVPAIPLFHIFGRIGCFLAGCCHGAVNEQFGIAYSHSVSAENGIPYLPIQLVESFGNLIIFIIMCFSQKKKHKYFQPAGLYFTMYGTMRFVLEFFRGDTIRGHVGALSTSQWISLVVIPLGVYCLVCPAEKNFMNRLYTPKKAK